MEKVCRLSGLLSRGLLERYWAARDHTDIGFEEGGVMLTTPLCRHLGMTAPIFSVGMGALAGPTLAAAASRYFSK